MCRTTDQLGSAVAGLWLVHPRTVPDWPLASVGPGALHLHVDLELDGYLVGISSSERYFAMKAPPAASLLTGVMLFQLELERQPPWSRRADVLQPALQPTSVNHFHSPVWSPP